MKKLNVIACLVVWALSLGMQASAQDDGSHAIQPFYDAHGAVRIETQELDRGADTIMNTFHRADDVVWSRIVYRIIDMRYKQNYRLYFPIKPEENKYHSLFRIMLDALASGELHAYQKQEDYNIKPLFDERLLLKPSDLISYTTFGEDPEEKLLQQYGSKESYEEFFGVGAWETTIANAQKSLFYYCDPGDTTHVCFKANPVKIYPEYAKNQMKFLIQEVVFFDKHYSRLFTKIIAIAPLYAAMESEAAPAAEDDGEGGEGETAQEGDGVQDNNAGSRAYEALCAQLLWWCPFDEFRPFLARRYMIPDVGNDKARVTFDEFFSKRLFSSYIIGDDNMYDRLFISADQKTSEEEIHREQERVATELLTLEQDLWEY